MAYKNTLLFSIKEVYDMARTQKYSQFEDELFQRIDGTPTTIDKSERVNNSYFQVVEIKMNEV